MRRTLAAAAASALLGTLLVAAGAAATGSTTRASVGGDGAQANAKSRFADVSGDGRFVAFDSTASTLVAGDTNGLSDVFVRDRVGATTERVSVGDLGVQGNGGSFGPSISRDGRWVVFTSTASNLVPGDTNGKIDVFLRDRALATTRRVSLTSAGAQAGGDSFAPQISADGRYVVFYTFSDLAGTGLSNGSVNAYRVDLASGQVLDVCRRWDGAFIRLCVAPSISGDGRYVAFEAQGQLSLDDTNGVTDIYVRDMTDGVTSRASVSTAGAQANAASQGPSISANGRVVAFTSSASSLVAGDLNGQKDVFVRDLAGNTTERVSVASAGSEANAASFTRDFSSASHAVSEDGRYVAFQSFASNLVAGDTNGVADVFVRDRSGSGSTVIASLTWEDAIGAGASTYGAISADGRYVAFESSAADLVAGDTNAVSDVFVRDLRANTPPTISLPADLKVYLADGLNATASFTDPDADQDWTGTVTYSPGGSPVALELRPDKTFALVHAYPEIGVYLVAVTLTDGAGGTATGSFTVTVEPTPVTYADERAGISIVVQLDPRASDHGRVWFIVPGTGTYTLDAAASLRTISGTTVMIDHSGPAVLESDAGSVVLSVELRARLDPGRHVAEGMLTDSAGRRFQVVARP